VNLRLKPISATLFAALLIASALPARPLFGSNSKADEQAGAVLFRDKGCAHCHGEGGIGGKKAPSLIGLRNDKNWPPAKITSQILNGGQKMPAFSESLTDQEAAQLVAYLRTKHRPVPPPTPAPPTAPPAQ
jgi:mono/diheme cytochrome c family protein